MSAAETVGDFIEERFGEPLVEKEVTVSPSQTLVEAAADSGILPQEEVSVLNDYLDGDALNQLFDTKPETSSRMDGVAVVTVWDHLAVISSDRVAIYELLTTA
jgi:hypothetical protein